MEGEGCIESERAVGDGEVAVKRDLLEETGKEESEGGEGKRSG